MASAPCAARMSAEALGDEIQGLVPGGRTQLTGLADQRGAQAVGVTVVLERIAPLDAGVAVVDRAIGAADRADLAVADQHLEVAAHAAVGARRPHGVVRHQGLRLVAVAQGVGGAALDASPARDAVRAAEVLVERADHPALVPAAVHGEHEAALHLVAGADAAVAVDALRRVEAQVGVAAVDLGGDGVAAETRVRDAVAREQGLQLGRPVSGCRVVLGLRVGAEHQFQQIAAQALHARAVGVDVLSGGGRRVARRQHPARPLGGERDLDAAQPAGAEGLQRRLVAEHGDRVASAVPGHEVVDGLAGRQRVGGAVDPGLAAHAVTSPWNSGRSSSPKCARTLRTGSGRPPPSAHSEPSPRVSSRSPKAPASIGCSTDASRSHS